MKFEEKIIDRLIEEYDVNPNGLKNAAVVAAGVATPLFSYAANFAILSDLDQTKINAASQAVQAALSDVAIAPVAAVTYLAVKALISKEPMSLRKALLTGFAAATIGTVATAPLTHNHYEKIEQNSHTRGFDAAPR